MDRDTIAPPSHPPEPLKRGLSRSFQSTMICSRQGGATKGKALHGAQLWGCTEPKGQGRSQLRGRDAHSPWLDSAWSWSPGSLGLINKGILCPVSECFRNLPKPHVPLGSTPSPQPQIVDPLPQTSPSHPRPPADLASQGIGPSQLAPLGQAGNFCRCRRLPPQSNPLTGDERDGQDPRDTPWTSVPQRSCLAE